MGLHVLARLDVDLWDRHVYIAVTGAWCIATKTRTSLVRGDQTLLATADVVIIYSLKAPFLQRDTLCLTAAAALLSTAHGYAT